MKNPEQVRKFIKDNMNISGVYAIKNIATDKVYIGSTINLGSRLSKHFADLKKNKHHCATLQDDCNSNRIDCFKVILLEKVENHLDLLLKEVIWKNKVSNKYNITTEIVELPTLTQKELKRFDESWYKDENDCWVWVAGSRSNGYGWFSIKGRKFSAHRISNLIYKGKMLPDKIILHTCDNKKCVNPDHLAEGSHYSNHLDRRDKGIGNFKITFNDASRIRQLCLHNKDLYAKDLLDLIQKNLNIKLDNKQHLFSILLNKVWKDINWIPMKCKRLSGEDCPWTRINWVIVRDIRNLYNTTNYTLKMLACIVKAKYDIEVGYKFIHKVIKNQRWKDSNYQPSRLNIA